MSIIGTVGSVPTQREAESEIERSRHEALDLHDLQGIRQRHPPCQIVIEPPRKASANNEKWTCNAVQRWRSGPPQRCCAGDQKDHSKRNAAIEILMKDEPRHNRCGGSLQRQQKRARRRAGACKASHQQ